MGWLKNVFDYESPLYKKNQRTEESHQDRRDIVASGLQDVERRRQQEDIQQLVKTAYNYPKDSPERLAIVAEIERLLPESAQKDIQRRRGQIQGPPAQGQSQAQPSLWGYPQEQERLRQENLEERQMRLPEDRLSLAEEQQTFAEEQVRKGEPRLFNLGGGTVPETQYAFNPQTGRVEKLATGPTPLRTGRETTIQTPKGDYRRALIDPVTGETRRDLGSVPTEDPIIEMLREGRLQAKTQADIDNIDSQIKYRNEELKMKQAEAEVEDYKPTNIEDYLWPEGQAKYVPENPQAAIDEYAQYLQDSEGLSPQRAKSQARAEYTALTRKYPYLQLSFGKSQSESIRQQGAGKQTAQPTVDELRRQNTEEAYDKGVELGYWK